MKKNRIINSIVWAAVIAAFYPLIKVAYIADFLGVDINSSPQQLMIFDRASSLPGVSWWFDVFLLPALSAGVAYFLLKYKFNRRQWLVAAVSAMVIWLLALNSLYFPPNYWIVIPIIIFGILISGLNLDNILFPNGWRLIILSGILTGLVPSLTWGAAYGLVLAVATFVFLRVCSYLYFILILLFAPLPK